MPAGRTLAQQVHREDQREDEGDVGHLAELRAETPQTIGTAPHVPRGYPQMRE
jgi:hypothetical protein